MWRRILQLPHWRIFIEKNEKKSIFSKNTPTDRFLQKLSFFSKNTATDRLFYGSKIKIYMVGPIIFYKKSQICHFFCSFNLRKLILKNLILKKEMIISRSNYDKNINFVEIFQKKIDFFSFFCQIFHVLEEKLHLLEYGTHF